MKKITVALPDDLIEYMKAVAVVEGISAVDVLRRSIKTERFLTKLESEGCKILSEDTKGNLSRIIRK